MRITDRQIKRALSIILCLILLVSTVAFAVTANAEEAELTDTGADTYYLYGQATNSPDFGGMSSPTGTFSYDSSKGY